METSLNQSKASPRLACKVWVVGLPKSYSSLRVTFLKQPENVNGVASGSWRPTFAIGRSVLALILVTPGKNSVAIFFLESPW